MTKLYLIRHGETKWNVEQKLQGQTDIPLNDKGRHQAKHIANFLQNKTLDIIYSSPLSRAFETAKEIHAHHLGIPLQTDSRLKEQDVGIADGELITQLPITYPLLTQWNLWKHPSYAPENGESLIAVSNRVKEFLEEIIPKNINKTICIVSHKMSVRCMQLLLLKASFDEMSQFTTGNTAITSMLVNYSGLGKLELLDYTDHLGPEQYCDENSCPFIPQQTMS